MMKKFLASIIALRALVSFATAASVQPLTVNEMAFHGATHRVILTGTDLTTTSTNTAQTVAVLTVGAKQGVEVVSLELKTAFDGTLIGTGSLAVTVGDGGDVDRLLASTELAADGTEVFLKAGTGTLGLYTSSDTVDVIFTPNAEDAVASFATGEVWLYIRIRDAN